MRKGIAAMFFKREENHEKIYMRMSKVMEYLPYSRSHLYRLKDKGILKAVAEVIDGKPTYKFLTSSVLELANVIEENHKLKIDLENKEKKEAAKRLASLRRYVYGN